jgi:hypothetical protein
VTPRYFDFLRCKCGYPTQLRPPTFAPEETDPIWTNLDETSAFVACIRCKRVYRVADLLMESIPATQGLAPYDPEAPMRVFLVPLGCDELGCEAQRIVIAVRRHDTGPPELGGEAATWVWADLKCPEGHEIPWPQWQ